jgi:RNA polymerase sigma-70 factor (ECF subfamily)
MSDAELPQQPSDEDLLQRACQGNEVAFGAVYERFRAKLFTFVKRLVGDYHLAEDIVEEVFVRVLLAATGRPGFDPGHVKEGRRTKAMAWLYRIAYNLAITDLRRPGRRDRSISRTDDDQGGLLHVATILDPTPTPVDIAIAREHRAALSACLDKLTPEEYEVAVLIYLVDFTFEETAAILETRIGTVMGRSGRVRAKLLECLKRKGITL